MSYILAPSLLAADFARLDREVQLFEKSPAQWLHLDVMDGRFVPNISFGIPVIKSLRPHSKKIFDVHLMIVEPEKYIGAFRDAGADVLTFHWEATAHPHRMIQAIHDAGMQAGIALNPHTPVSLLKDIIADLDVVCLMSVNPGFGGQAFIPRTFKRIVELKALISAEESPAKIEIDGGVGKSNFRELIRAGADILVAGSAVFKADDPAAAIDLLLSACSDTRLA